MKYTCKCGKILCSSVNSEIDYKIYSDAEWDAIVNDDSIIKLALIPHSKYDVLVCPDCKRAYVFEANTKKVKHVYSLEECHIQTSEKRDIKIDLRIMRSLREKLNMHKLTNGRGKK